MQQDLRQAAQAQFTSIAGELKQVWEHARAELIQVSAQIRRIEALQVTTESQLRDTALSQVTRDLANARGAHQHACDRGFRGWGARFVASGELKAAQTRFDQAVGAFEAHGRVQERQARLAIEHAQVEQQRARLPALRASRQNLLQVQHTVGHLRTTLAPLGEALAHQGWLAHSIGADLLAIEQQVAAHDYAEASARAEQLRYQQVPSAEAYAEMTHQATQWREAFYAVRHGIAATGALPAIALGSAQLALGALTPACAQALAQRTQPSDAWQTLTSLARSPQAFQDDWLWAVYWAMLGCEQDMAAYLDQARSNEDPLNGRFSTLLETWLGQWVRQQLPRFGYPQGESVLGTLQLSGSTQESRLGADLGIIVSLDLGGLQCRKAILLQAKRAQYGIANLGSQKQQLPTLAKRPGVGHYLFYHQAPDLVATVPTVASALALQALVEGEDKYAVNAEYVRLDVRNTGWDWASFFTLGVCQPHSGVGETFDTPEQALRILGDGDSGELPAYVFVVAIDNDGFALQLRERLRQHYQDLQQARAQSKSGPSRGRGMSGPG